MELKEKEEKEAQLAAQNSVINSYLEEQKVYKERKTSAKAKGDDREAQTLALLNKFKSKIAAAKESSESKPADEVEEEKDEVDEENPTNISWYVSKSYFLI